MSRPNARNGTNDLSSDADNGNAPRQFTPQCVRKDHGGIEVST